MSDSILQVNQIKDKGGNAVGITVADSSANVTIGNLTHTAGSIGSAVTGNWGWKLLETKTATAGDGNIRIGSGTIFSSTYNLYKVIIDNWRPSANSQIFMKFYLNGDSSLHESNYDYDVRGYGGGNALQTDGSIANSRAALIPSSILATGSGSNTANDHCFAEISIQNPSVSGRKIISYMGHYFRDLEAVHYQGTAGLARHGSGSGTFHGILFYPSTGNVQAANIRTYGVVNA